MPFRAWADSTAVKAHRYNHRVDLVPTDTICALATPPGRGGIGVIRVSGPSAFTIVDSITGTSEQRSCGRYRGHTLHRAVIESADGDAIDDVLLAVFHGPKSYTGEDVVEISAHGGPVPLRLILSRLFEAGARPAGPGEFTQRGFLNGKLDLAQAEAVADIIEADTEEAHRLARRQQSGRLSREVEGIRDIILGVLARIEASIDFPEDVGELDTKLCQAEIESAIAGVDALLRTANAGILYREGVKVVLAGRPNVGKSSLMNALLRTDRAIVTPIPGTTRDVIEEAANVRGIRMRIVDTAGMRETSDQVEQIGVERTRASLEAADIALYIVDAAEGETPEDVQLRAEIADVPVISVWNKFDLVPPNTAIPDGAIPVSARDAWNIDKLEAAIVDTAARGAAVAVEDAGAVVTHSRHRHALKSAVDRLHDGLRTIDADMPADFISIDVRGALIALGEITGETATDDIINEIFSRFCIGK
jgi:tRNA modification GTPase